MGNYAISFHGYALVGSATVLTPINMPVQKKNRLEAFKLLAQSLRRGTSISATIAYIKRRAKGSWVMTKVGKKKYPVLVFLTSTEDTCIVTKKNQLLINGVAHHSHFPYEKFEAVPVYPD